MDNYLALIQLKTRYDLISGQYNQTSWPFQRKRKGIYILSLKNKNKRGGRERATPFQIQQS